MRKLHRFPLDCPMVLAAGGTQGTGRGGRGFDIASTANKELRLPPDGGREDVGGPTVLERTFCLGCSELPRGALGCEAEAAVQALSTL